MEAPDWFEAMHHERASLVESQAWDLIDEPQGYSTGFGQWVFGQTIGPAGEISRDKARLVFEYASGRWGHACGERAESSMNEDGKDGLELWKFLGKRCTRWTSG